MEIREVYEKYKHMDPLLSNLDEKAFESKILCDMWQAIKQHVVIEKLFEDGERG